MDNPIGDIFRGIGEAIGDIFSGGGCGYTPSQNINADTSKKISEELAERKAELRKKSENIEKKIIDHCTRFTENLLDEIKLVNTVEYGGRSLDINIDEIKRRSSELKKNVIGYSAGVFDERMITTDSELKKVLDEPDDKVRKTKFDNFCKSVANQANNGLQETVRKTVYLQSNMVQNEIKGRMTQLQSSMDELSMELMKTQYEKSRSDESNRKTKMERIYKYELCRILLDELR